MLSVILMALCFSKVQSQSLWVSEMPTVGTFSSPRIADLNNDGVGDIVMGAGREEFQACDTAVFALDGQTGQLLWRVSATDQIFGSATFLDITGDTIADVFMGGRSAELFAVNGKSGEVIWTFCEVNGIKNPNGEGWYNFYNLQVVPDQDGDGIRDLVVSNGGDVMVEPFDPDRPPGKLVLISALTGTLIKEAQMPDGKETYMSVHFLPDSSGGEIVYGTGGETIGGHFYRVAFSGLLQGDLTGSVKLDSSATKGFIGPSLRADINEDGVSDIFTNAVDGRLLAFDGKSSEKLWEVILPNTESYSSPAVGFFNNDDIPDFFISYGRGVWPHLGWGIQKMVDGKTGQVEFTDSLGFYQNTSPLAVDLNGDGLDEIVMSVNFQEVDELYRKFFYTMLVSIDFASGEILNIGEIYEGSNLSSTPWIGDLDNDGFLDLIHCHGTSLRHTYTFDGMKIHRISTSIPVPQNISWGSYQGNEYDGTFSWKK